MNQVAHRIGHEETQAGAIFRCFPNSLLMLSGFSWKVGELLGNQENLPELKKAVAVAIEEAMRSYRPADQEGEEALAEIARTLKYSYSRAISISPDRVILRIPEKGLLELWPPGFICRKCGAYHLAEKEIPFVARCVNCGSREFEQPAFVHVCYSCSKIQPLMPPQRFARRSKKGVFTCNSCGSGTVGLFLFRKRIAASRWRCLQCGNEERVFNYCGCRAAPPYYSESESGSGANPMTLKPITMDPLKPAVLSMVYIQGKKVEDAAKDVLAGRLRYERRGVDVLSEQTARLIQDAFGIDVDNLYLVDGVAAALCCYGYYAKRGARVRFFEKRVKRTTYEVFVAKNEGKAVLVKMEYIPEQGEEEFTFLHTLEHALTKAFHIVGGVEEGAFMGKVIEDLDMVTIYEGSSSERGGLSYVFNYRLAEAFIEARRLLMSCKYNCMKACVGCVFVKDPLCHPTSGYFLPNDRLDRTLVMRRLWRIRI